MKQAISALFPQALPPSFALLLLKLLPLSCMRKFDVTEIFNDIPLSNSFSLRPEISACCALWAILMQSLTSFRWCIASLHSGEYRVSKKKAFSPQKDGGRACGIKADIACCMSRHLPLLPSVFYQQIAEGRPLNASFRQGWEMFALSLH